MHIIRGVELNRPTPIPKVEPVAHIEWFGFWKTTGVIRVYEDDPVAYRSILTVRRSQPFSGTISFVGMVSTGKDRMTLASHFRAIGRACLKQGITAYREEVIRGDKVIRRVISFHNRRVISTETEDAEAFVRKKKA